MPHVRSLHHVTMLASGAAHADRLFSGTLGLRRVKRTVNADVPDVHHLFYGDDAGTPGTLVTVHPFANMPAGQIGTSQIVEPVFGIAPGAAQEWVPYLGAAGFAITERKRLFERNRFAVEGPGGERFAIQVEARDTRAPQRFVQNGRAGIRGLHAVTVNVRNPRPMARLLQALGYEAEASDENVTRYAVAPGANGARFVDVAEVPNGPAATIGAGSVHHAAFAVRNGADLKAVRDAVAGSGFEVTDIASRGYFDSFFLRGPEGMLFEVATDGPGMTVDEDGGSLGERLILPPELETRRPEIEVGLEPLDA